MDEFMEDVIQVAFQFFLWKTTLWFKTKLTALVRYKLGEPRTVTLDDIEILYSSPHYIVINKQYDVLINCDDKRIKVTVEHQLRHLYPDLVNPKLQHSFHFVHRLDFPTSGVLCVASHKKASICAMKAFSERATKKYYVALLRGHVSSELIDINCAIGTDSRPEYVNHKMCTVDAIYCKNPREAFTRLLILATGFYNNEPVTKVMLKPITGRRHQLRVHCMVLGHTIVGDFSYSNQKDIYPFRMFLHSHRLVMPTTFECVDVTAGDPFDERRLKRWIPFKIYNLINEETYHKLDTFPADITVYHSNRLE